MAGQGLAACPTRNSLLPQRLQHRSLASVHQISKCSLHTAARCRKTSGRKLQKQVSAVLDVDESTFEAEVVQADKPVLLDFWATWCGPCKLIAPFMDKLEQEYGSALKVVKLDADANKDLVEKYKVYGLPTVMLFKDGKKVESSHAEGAITLPKLRQYLEKHGIAAAAASTAS